MSEGDVDAKPAGRMDNNCKAVARAEGGRHEGWNLQGQGKGQATTLLGSGVGIVALAAVQRA